MPKRFFEVSYSFNSQQLDLKRVSSKTDQTVELWADANHRVYLINIFNTLDKIILRNHRIGHFADLSQARNYCRQQLTLIETYLRYLKNQASSEEVKRIVEELDFSPGRLNPNLAQHLKVNALVLISENQTEIFNF